MPHPYRSQILDHLGLVAGMFDALGIGEVIDRATRHHPDTQIVTTGDAVNANVLNGLGLVNQQRSLVQRFFQAALPLSFRAWGSLRTPMKCVPASCPRRPR